MAACPMRNPGDVLGNRYRIVKLLGRGGMGAVYLAEDSRLPGKLWAVKEMYSPASDYSAAEDEARFLAECSHPGLAAVADYLPPDGAGCSYLIMEYIPGDTLEAVFRRANPFPWQQAVRIGMELCGILGYLHEGRPKPIIHRDLKPSNIMLDAQGRVRLIDFGTARHYKPSADADTMYWGTLGFAAPEQLQGKQTDARTDLYTLGAVLYYLLSGGSFYDRQTDVRAGLAHGCPKALVSAIGRMLEEDPALRFQRAEEVRASLEPLFRQDAAGEWNRSAGRAGQQQQGQGSGQVRQLLVVGGLTSGTGTSFTAVVLARMLNRMRISHCLLELPGVQPDLFHTLFGEKNAPRDYSFLVDRFLCGDGAVSSPAWKDGYTEWLPLPPAYRHGTAVWTAEHAKRLIGGLSHPVVIVDAGSGWEEEAWEAVCKPAARILLVCDPSPVRLSRSQTARSWLKLAKLREDGADVQIIANRSMDFPGRPDWLDALPAKPLCFLPEIPAEEIWKCQWKGELAADLPRFSSQLAEALKPVTKPIAECGDSGSSGPGIWLRLKESLGGR